MTFINNVSAQFQRFTILFSLTYIAVASQFLFTLNMSFNERVVCLSAAVIASACAFFIIFFKRKPETLLYSIVNISYLVALYSLFY